MTAVDEERWKPRRLLGWLLGAVLVVVPVLASIAAGLVVARMLPPVAGLLPVIAWWATVGLAALVVLWAVERALRRFGPLVALLHLSLTWPDRAPSRFAVARTAGSVRELRRRVEEAADPDADVPSAQAAQTILSLVTALSLHDRRTRGHAERVRVFTDMISEELELPEPDRDRLRWAALVHDIGKLAVDADILSKPAALSDEEWEEVRLHPRRGAELCGPLLGWLAPYDTTIAQHHERYDGSGYPAGLAGDMIGLGARIVSVADAFEVMTAPRSYQRPVSVAAARRELVAHAGGQFDPTVVRAFLSISVPRLVVVLGPMGWFGMVPIIGRPPEPLTLSASAAGVAVGGLALFGALGPQAPIPAEPGTTEVAGEVIERDPVDEVTVDEEGDTAPGGERPAAPVEDAATEVPPAAAGALSGPAPVTVAAAPAPAPAPVAPVPAAPAPAAPPAPPEPDPDPDPEAEAPAPEDREVAQPGGIDAGTGPDALGPPTDRRTPPRDGVDEPPPAEESPDQEEPPAEEEPRGETAPPEARPDAFRVEQRSSSLLDVLANDVFGAPADWSTFELVELPRGQHTAAVERDARGYPRVRFDAGRSANAGDFTYAICDVEGRCATAVVAVEVD
jgi:hypothetical protein